jgi:hypothetical protein
MDTPILEFNYLRRFGVEMEFNAFDGKGGPYTKEKPPLGIFHVGNIVPKVLGEYIEVRTWGPTHWNKTNGCWVVKPDGSCGMELCSPVSKGWYGLEKICKVADAIRADAKINADRRCSLHVHVDVSDCTKEQLANIIAYWIKCELVFMDSVPDTRKNNRYCQFIGLWDWFSEETCYTPDELIRVLGNQKYLTINTWHLSKGCRQTLEFRIGENMICRDSYALKNWVRLVIHFVEMTKDRPAPPPYIPGNPWSSWLWLDPNEVFELLGFDGRCDLSPGLRQVRNWFIARLMVNQGAMKYGIQSKAGRRFAHTQVLDMAHKYMQEEGLLLEKALNPPDRDEAVYGKIYQV